MNICPKCMFAQSAGSTIVLDHTLPFKIKGMHFEMVIYGYFITTHILNKCNLKVWGMVTTLYLFCRIYDFDGTVIAIYLHDKLLTPVASFRYCTYI